MLRPRGIVVVPAFAVGRSQQVIYVLNVLMDRAGCRACPSTSDSPMAVDATRIYRNYPAELEASTELKSAMSSCQSYLESPERSTPQRARRPDIGQRDAHRAVACCIISRAAAGRPQHRRAGGYQAAGTRGRALLTAKTLRIHGQDVPVRAKVEDLLWILGPRRQREILRWLGLPAPAAKLFLTHGEPGRERWLKASREKSGMSRWPAWDTSRHCGTG